MYSCKNCSFQTLEKGDYFLHIRKSNCGKHKEKKELCSTDITFGRYKDLTLDHVLRDREYCHWLLKQDWFAKQYEYLYNQVRQYNPEQFFLPIRSEEVKINTIEDFLQHYKYFQLYPLKDVKTNLTNDEKICYTFYLSTINKLKEKIYNDYTFNIKAPSSWLKQFEQTTNLSRDIFKEFIMAYDLPNITTIVEDIKKMAGLDYKGGKSYLIAKERSLQQEKFWEGILKGIYGQDIGVQYKYQNCFFDFVHINKSTLFECKLGWKDFDRVQFKKYTEILKTFNLVYLIGNHTIVDWMKETVFTVDPESQKTINHFQIKRIDKIEDYFKIL